MVYFALVAITLSSALFFFKGQARIKRHELCVICLFCGDLYFFFFLLVLMEHTHTQNLNQTGCRSSAQQKKNTQMKLTLFCVRKTSKGDVLQSFILFDQFAQ